VSPPVNEEDNNNEEDNDDDADEEDVNNEDEEDTDVDEEEDIFDFNLNLVEGKSEYELMRLQRVHRHNARLERLGLLAPITSATSLSSNHSNSKKRSAPQDDVERRVQPTRNAKKRHLTGILTTLSSTRGRVQLILQTPERRILTARGWTRWSTAPAAEMMRRMTTRTS